MSYLINSSSETIDVVIIAAETKFVKSESIGNMLNGAWHVQTIGSRAKKCLVRLYAPYSVVLELLDYADTKEPLTVNYLDEDTTGIIMNQPDFEIATPAEDPIYSVTFDMAVVSDV